MTDPSATRVVQGWIATTEPDSMSIWLIPWDGPVSHGVQCAVLTRDHYEALVAKADERDAYRKDRNEWKALCESITSERDKALAEVERLRLKAEIRRLADEWEPVAEALNAGVLADAERWRAVRDGSPDAWIVGRDRASRMPTQITVLKGGTADSVADAALNQERSDV